jgi:mRNA interferase HigB
MRVIAISTLRTFWELQKEAEQPLRAWYAEVKHATWKGTADVKRMYPSASFVVGNRVVFNIGGNKFRLVVKVKYDFGIVYIRFVGKHSEYDRIDVETI